MWDRSKKLFLALVWGVAGSSLRLGHMQIASMTHWAWCNIVAKSQVRTQNIEASRMESRAQYRVAPPPAVAMALGL